MLLGLWEECLASHSNVDFCACYARQKYGNLQFTHVANQNRGVEGAGEQFCTV